MKTTLIIAACLALAAPVHSEEIPPPMGPAGRPQPTLHQLLMQPRSEQPSDQGPIWVAATRANCDGFQAVLWAGQTPDAKSYWRLYWDGDKPPRGVKTFKEVNGVLYFRGKKCTAE